MDDDKIEAAVDTLTERLRWQGEEIERLKQVCAEQDRRARSVTARGEIRLSTGVFIVTCPAGDEAHLMRTVFAGFAAMAWTSLSMATESLGAGKSIKDLAAVLFDEEG